MNIKLKNLTEKDIKEEKKLCQKYNKYFYNNYCKTDDMPEYSDEVFQNYLKFAQEKRNVCITKQRRAGFKPNYFQSSEIFKQYPLDINDIFNNH